MVPHWISRLVPPSAKDRYIASLEKQIEYFQGLLASVTSSHLQGLHMPGVSAERPELPHVKSKALPSQWRRAAEAQDRKNHPQPGEKDANETRN